MDKYDNYIKLAIIVGAILSVFAILSFAVAIYKGFTPTINSTPKPVQVYINDNDSVIEKLQTDVADLTEIIRQIQSDSIIFTYQVVPKTARDRSRAPGYQEIRKAFRGKLEVT